MGYLDNFLGARCWSCHSGFIGVVDKGFGVHLVCSKYPKSCQFISATPVICPNCENGFLTIEHHENKRYLCHFDCRFKSVINDIELKIGKPTKEEKGEIKEIIDQGLLIEYLNTVSLDELNKLWESKIWEDPVNIPFAEKLEEDFIKESVRKVRSIKWKLKNK